jgi:hypothetical protein
MRLADINENLSDRAEMGLKMRMAGWHAIGSGAHATAWVKVDESRKYVLKAFDADTGYFHFYNVARKNQGNAHIPLLFGGITKLKFKNGTYLWMVKLERLKSISLDTNMSKTVDVMNQCMRKDPDNFFNLSTVYDCFKDYSEAYWAAPIDKKVQTKFHELMHDQPNYYRTLLMLNNYKENIATEMFWDLHANNVVARGTNLVILDPWVSYGKDARQDMIDRIRAERKNRGAAA